MLAPGERVDAAERVCWPRGVMEHELQRNEWGQPVGWPVEGWSPRPRPPRTSMVGRFATVEPLDPDRHSAELFDANIEDREGRLWTYYNFGPFTTLPEYRAWLDAGCANPDRYYHAIRDNAQARAVGVAVFQGAVRRGHCVPGSAPGRRYPPLVQRSGDPA
jgi:hypothetical protein